MENESEKKQDNYKLNVHLCSFSYRSGIDKNDYDDVFNAKKIKNPSKSIRKIYDGTNKELQKDLFSKPENVSILESFFQKMLQHIQKELDELEEDEKAEMKFAIGCERGRHRSVAIAEKLVKMLSANKDFKFNDITVSHRDLDKKDDRTGGKNNWKRKRKNMSFQKSQYQL